MNLWSVLHLAGDMIWKGCVLAVPLPWADLDVRAVLGHLQAKLWQVHDLPRHLSLGLHRLPLMAAPALPSEPQGNDLIGMLSHLERLTYMTTLSARRPVSLPALTLGLPRFALAGRLTGGRAVLCPPYLQVLEPSEEMSHLCLEFTDPYLETLTVGTGSFADAPLYQGDPDDLLSSYVRSMINSTRGGRSQQACR